MRAPTTQGPRDGGSRCEPWRRAAENGAAPDDPGRYGGGMRVKLRRFERPGHRVVRPWKPLAHTALGDPEHYGWLVGDRDGLTRLGALFAFAAASRRTIVHVPLRDGAPIEGCERFVEHCGGRLDLLLVHHSSAFRATRWPDLRRTLTGAGTPMTVRVDRERTSRDARTWAERRHRRDFRDHLRPVSHARTLCLTGSRTAFAAAAVEFFDAAELGPRLKGVAKGHPALVTCLTHILTPEDDPRRREVDISYKAHPGALRTRKPVQAVAATPGGEGISRPTR